MTVKELIQQLQKCPEEMTVVVYNENNDTVDVEGLIFLESSPPVIMIDWQY